MAFHPMILAGGAAAVLVAAGVTAAAVAGPADRGTIALHGATTAQSTTQNTAQILADPADDQLEAELVAASTADPTELTSRGVARKLCLRLPSAEARVEHLEQTLAAGASTRGSIAWLQARQSKATAAGHGDLATFLADRIIVRQKVQALLPDRLTELRAAEPLCARVPAAGATTS